MKIEEHVCKMCGRCCYYEFEGKIKKCKHLVRFKSGRTICRIYNDRLERVIDFNQFKNQYVICLKRNETKFDFPGCPFNTDRPMSYNMEDFYGINHPNNSATAEYKKKAGIEIAIELKRRNTCLRR